MEYKNGTPTFYPKSERMRATLVSSPGEIQKAKRPETPKKRISETVEKASQNIRANQYQP
jgi:hypothetical protein